MTGWRLLAVAVLAVMSACTRGDPEATTPNTSAPTSVAHPATTSSAVTPPSVDAEAVLEFLGTTTTSQLTTTEPVTLEDLQVTARDYSEDPFVQDCYSQAAQLLLDFEVVSPNAIPWHWMVENEDASNACGVCADSSAWGEAPDYPNCVVDLWWVTMCSGTDMFFQGSPCESTGPDESPFSRRWEAAS